MAWFILKYTLDYPQRLAGQTQPLPDFALADRDFMAEYFKKAKGHDPGGRAPAPEGAEAQGSEKLGAYARGENLELFDAPELTPDLFEADMAWHVRAWGQWVLREARRALARFYPTYAEYCTLKPYRVVPLDHAEPPKLVPLNDAGEPQIDPVVGDIRLPRLLHRHPSLAGPSGKIRSNYRDWDRFMI